MDHLKLLATLGFCIRFYPKNILELGATSAGRHYWLKVNPINPVPTVVLGRRVYAVQSLVSSIKG